MPTKSNCDSADHPTVRDHSLGICFPIESIPAQSLNLVKRAKLLGNPGPTIAGRLRKGQGELYVRSEEMRPFCLYLYDNREVLQRLLRTKQGYCPNCLQVQSSGLQRRSRVSTGCRIVEVSGGRLKNLNQLGVEGWELSREAWRLLENGGRSLARRMSTAGCGRRDDAYWTFTVPGAELDGVLFVSKRGTGHIGWVSSREGLNTNPFTGIYPASKHAAEAIA